MGESTSERAENIVDGGAPFYGIYETRDGKYVEVGAIEVLAEWGVGASAIEALARSGAMLQVGPGAG